MEVRYAFVEYSQYTKREITKIKTHLARLPGHQSSRLSSELLNKKIFGMEEALARSQRFLDAVVDFEDSMSPYPIENENPGEADATRTSSRQVDKVTSTLHQLVREWSEEGQEERNQSYLPILQELERRLPVNSANWGKLKVLVPGAGLGRLPLEIVSRGYETQGKTGNEFSYFMLFASKFLLNGIDEAKSFLLSPFVNNQCNHLCVGDMLRSIQVPDVNASAVLALQGGGVCPADFSMTAGEWLEVYADQKDAWDAIVTCFFLDTAPVVMEYIEAIARLLKPGGVWINLGPLLYHWAQSSPGVGDERFNRSVELSWEEIQHVCQSYGLKIVNKEVRESIYNCNERSMMHTRYRCIFCTAIKQEEGT
ncbi:unnamed protein product [Discosporangium mesarthrocarpum]